MSNAVDPRMSAAPCAIEPVAPAARRSLQADETVGLSGRLPMSVVIGRAASVDVSVRGQPFDLGPQTGSGGVARFEIKP